MVKRDRTGTYRPLSAFPSLLCLSMIFDASFVAHSMREERLPYVIPSVEPTDQASLSQSSLYMAVGSPVGWPVAGAPDIDAVSFGTR